MSIRPLLPRILGVPLLMALLATPGLRAYGQCTNNNSLLGGAITPACPGIATVPCITAGQYALVNVAAGNVYSFSTCGAAWDTQITLFNNAGGGSIGFHDDAGACGGLQSYLGWTATFTGQLRVLVDAYPCASNSLCASLIITCGTAPAPVTNNECAGAITLAVNEVCTMQSFTNAGATRSTTSPYPSCGGTFTTTNFKDVWFQFTAPPNGVVIIETAPGTLTDARMSLQKGTCGALTNVDCDVDGGVGRMVKIDRRCDPLVPGDQYFIRVWGASGATGSFGICIRGFASFPTPQEDCSGGNTICSSAPITNQVDFVGCSNDLSTSNRGCLLGNERQGSWYFFSPTAAGTASFTISPVGGSVDYDFAIWGPLDAVACPPNGPPARCSWAYPPNVPGYPAAPAFETGLRATAPENSEDQTGDGFVAPLPLVVGKIYIMYIDNFDVTGQSFNLTWSFAGSASLDCATLPVELIALDATARNTLIDVSWATATERNSDHFVVERSPDNEAFNPIGTVAAAGNAQSRRDYALTDTDPFHGANYYRLKQVDFNGTFVHTHAVVAFMGGTGNRPALFPNPATDVLNVAFNSPLEGSALIHVQDALGRLASQSMVIILRGDQAATVPTEGLAPGWYNLSIALPDGSRLPGGGFLKR